MRKADLKLEQLEQIDFAVKQGFGSTEWELISQLSGGLSGVPIFKIKSNNQFYAIKLDDINDKNIDLVRCYLTLTAAAEQGFAPTVYLTDSARGIILMKFIDSKPRPQSSPESIKIFADVVRRLHDGKPFEKWKSIFEILDHFYQKISPIHKEIDLVKQCLGEVVNLEKNLSDKSDIRPSHCDLNPGNVLFDGDNYLLVDWHAASPQNLYFDLACCATFFYFNSDELCSEFLKSYFGREPTEDESNKFYLMKILTNIYYGIIFISISNNAAQSANAIDDEIINQLPEYIDFMQSIGTGIVNLAEAKTQQQFGLIFLKIALVEIMGPKYQKNNTPRI